MSDIDDEERSSAVDSEEENDDGGKGSVVDEKEEADDDGGNNDKASDHGNVSIVDEGLDPHFINDPLEILFGKNKPDDIDAEEAKVITQLIRKILRYEPSERPTASELLQHKWFNERNKRSYCDIDN